MADERVIDDPLGAIALLGDPNRRRLYELVSLSPTPVGRDAAAATLGISRELAAFHLDRLADAGLLEVAYKRLGDRRGPGAGRPAKVYSRVASEVAVSLPPRAYGRLARRLAETLVRSDGAAGAEVLLEVAASEGSDDGTAVRRRAGPRAGRRRTREALVGLLRDAGYEPVVDAEGDGIGLRNCPYRALADSHRDLTCGMNLAWAEGVMGSLGGTGLRAELSPSPGRCCVVFRQAGAPATEG